MDQVYDNKKQNKWKQISEKERYQIEAYLNIRLSAKEIGIRLERNRRTIEREIARGKVEQLTTHLVSVQRYCADAGERVHIIRGANKGRGLKIGSCHELARYIEYKIKKENYSPDAIIGRIEADGNRFDVKICTKTLYNYIDKEIFMGISNKDLPVKRNRKRDYKQVRRVSLNNLKGRSIEERPKELEERTDVGHWEMDCVVSGKGSKRALLVLTERTSRRELIFGIKAQTQDCVGEVIDMLERRHKGRFTERFKSITMDNGSEFLACLRIEASILRQGERRTTTYYAHPYSAWERGSNEVGNKLIRRFIPKGANISKYSKADIKRIQNWMNNYPRKIFGYKTANEIYKIATSV